MSRENKERSNTASSRRVILFGDYTSAPYHPLQGMDKEVINLLGDAYRVDPCEDSVVLIAGLSNQVDVLISYADRWTSTLTEGQVDGMLAFVQGGGGLVSLHCGISLANHERLLPLFGAKFVGHPEFQPLSFSVAAGVGGASHADGRDVQPVDQSLAASLEPFVLAEEPYQYAFADAPNGDRTVLLDYEYEGELYPAVWTQTYGQGRVINVMPGHTVESLQHPAVQKLLIAAVEWAARR
ncbi:conserved hypothetical protein [Paenibacillus curdlanolyticus YK9]|uniref:ThuA-like domain-containing protein n=1 Tax=Paenibacillus curdlanolyticus YK9 TaxID=717606 RepID=E0I7L8_9BACL|nr:ThuA domain-containing protein [Paenibacillus curdlanolyticus]EFM11173.1 conserved hypothetical protein [Paenibacillus curdlanolyticus YK9]